MGITAESVSREQLYEQVWATPMRRLSQKYGVSDVGLAKICKRLDIPRPPVGYWAKKKVGKAPPRPPLPQNHARELQTVTITPSPEPSGTGTDLESIVECDDDIKAILVKVKTLPTIKVAASLRNPHQLVRLTERSLRDSEPDPQNLVSPSHMDKGSVLSARVSSKSIKRTMRFYDTLIKAVERLGGKVAVEESHWREETVVYMAKEKVTTIRVRERYRQKRREPEGRRDSFMWPKYTFIPTGILVVELGSPWRCDGNFADTASIPIEDRINELILKFVRAAHEVRHRRQQEEEERRRRVAREKERKEKLRLIEAEEARIQKLLEEVNNWHQSLRIRCYASAVRARVEQSGDIESGSELSRWLT